MDQPLLIDLGRALLGLPPREQLAEQLQMFDREHGGHIRPPRAMLRGAA